MPSIRNFYDNHSEMYEQFEAAALVEAEKYPLLFSIRQKERRLLDVSQGKKVFYFATGSGSDIAYLASLSARVVTVDFSREMIRRTQERLERTGISSLLKDTISMLTSEDLERFFTDHPDSVFIVHRDIASLTLPDNYFDYCFCYCTLPLLGDAALSILKRLVTTAQHGAVSVYDCDKLPVLQNYYRNFGFRSEVFGDTISLEGGFRYTAIPPEQMRTTVEKQNKLLTVISVGLGNIYCWSPKK